MTTKCMKRSGKTETGQSTNQKTVKCYEIPPFNRGMGQKIEVCDHGKKHKYDGTDEVRPNIY